ncbi:MAG: hypothetical protein GY856_18670, partial [bacterium]|nr:hypothetical protein [bacterium]
MRRVALFPLIACVLFALSGCTSPQPEPEVAADVVATFDGGSVTAADVDRALLELPAVELRMQAFESVEKLEQLVRQLVLQRLLLAEGHELGPDQDPEFVEICDQLRREVAIGLFLEAHPLAPEPPTEAELRAYYDEHVDARQRHARRMVYHLFKRYRPDGTRD